MQNLLIVGAGGFLGAILRYGTSQLLHARFETRFPLGTLFVNVLGCLVIGVLLTLALQRESLSEQGRLFLVVGLLGSFTTFSTFGYETFELLRAAEYRHAFVSVATNFGLGLTAVAAGVWLARGS